MTYDFVYIDIYFYLIVFYITEIINTKNKDFIIYFKDYSYNTRWISNTHTYHVGLEGR